MFHLKYLQNQQFGIKYCVYPDDENLEYDGCTNGKYKNISRFLTKNMFLYI